MADQIEPPPLFDNVDIENDRENDLFVSATDLVSTHEVCIRNTVYTIICYD